MKKVLVFGASSSRNSINKKLAYYAADLLTDVVSKKLDLYDFEMPLYSIDREKEEGVPEKTLEFMEYIKSHDGIIISFAEHNGAYSAVFKNLFDWISRLEGGAWADRPMLLMATSPGARGGKSVLEIATQRFPWNKGRVVSTFSLPSFHQNFDDENGIMDENFKNQLLKALAVFKKAMLPQPENAGIK